MKTDVWRNAFDTSVAVSMLNVVGVESATKYLSCGRLSVVNAFLLDGAIIIRISIESSLSNCILPLCN